MFDFLRNLGQSANDKQQEVLSAYLDGELAPADRRRVEQQLAQDSNLQQELDAMQFWQQEMRALPSRRVPRNFILDPAAYRPPQRRPLGAAYPVLRGATAFAALMLLIVLAANAYTGGFSAPVAQEASSVAMVEMAAGEAPPAEEKQSDMAAEETAAESFILEEPLAMEAEAPQAEAADAALMPQNTRELSPALELIEEGTIEAPFAPDALAGAEDGAASVPQDQALDSGPLPRTTTELAESQPISEPPPAADAAVSDALNPVVFGLGLLFILLAALTLIARGQR